MIGIELVLSIGTSIIIARTKIPDPECSPMKLMKQASKCAARHMKCHYSNGGKAANTGVLNKYNAQPIV